MRRITALNKKAFGGLLCVLLVMAALLFLPATTLDYWQAWAFLAVFGVSALAITLYLMKKDPELLERRVHAGPTAEDEEKFLARNLKGYKEYCQKTRFGSYLKFGE